MRASPTWQARVDIGGLVEGSGFLVSDRAVLTCAHVVRHGERAEVVFPGAPGLPPVPATVAMRGPWAGGAQDPGDVAVLELDRAVPLGPAVFAGLDEAYRMPQPKLVAYGFPAGYDEEGVQSELRVTSSQLIRDEWDQLEFWKGYGQEPVQGFSGAAVTLEGSGGVVGMVSAHDPVNRSGRMIPAQVLARHAPRLAELIPTPGYRDDDKRRLRELVERAPELPCTVDRLLRTALGPLGIAAPPAHGTDGLWEAVWYLLSEAPPRFGALPLAELTVRLADLVPDEALGRELRSWSRTHRALHHEPAPGNPAPTAPSDPERTRRWSPILVEIERSGADRSALLVEVSAYRDGSRRLVGEKRLAKGQVREWVLDRIDEAFGEIDTEGRELIAFALPRGWLNQPVDQWSRRKGNRSPLGCLSPVVVMDHDRRASDLLQFKLKKMWSMLDRQPGSALHRIGCQGAQRPERLSVQLQDVYGPVGFARPPKSPRDRELHRAALDAPAPIVVWPRAGCGGAKGDGRCDRSCAGNDFLDALAGDLALIPPAELPERIFELRKRAFLHEEAEPHWAADLALVWEDPRWFPEVRPLRHSPVG
jgi:NTP-dependent ternary conflict system VMAP-like protein/trypsin-like peptidase